MAERCTWISRVRCCRRRSKETYIYLYNPLMVGSSKNHCCLVCILFVFCLAIVAILAAAVIYHLDSNASRSKSNTTDDFDVNETTGRRQLPDFVDVNIDPCEHFYEFVCDKWTRQKPPEAIANSGNSERQWTSIRHELHGKLMTHLNNQSISNQSNHTASIYRLYQLCETQSPELLLDELHRYFVNFSGKEPYRSYLTLLKQVNLMNTSSTASVFLLPNPFFTITPSQSNSSTITRVKHRPLPSPMSVFSNSTTVNQTALQHLMQLDDTYQKLLSDESALIRPYEQEFQQDSLIIKRIRTFANYHQCLPSLTSNGSNGFENLVRLLNHYLDLRLHNFDTNSIDGSIRVLDKIANNHTLVEHLQRLTIELNAIEEIVISNHSNHSCVIDLLDRLLDRRMKSDELVSMINLDFFHHTADSFISDDWPFVFMLYERLLKSTPKETLVNFAFFDYYRKFIYPYYQPHVHPKNDMNISQNRESHGYTYHATHLNLSCRIDSCFDILNCYHPSLLNQVMNDHNQTTIDAARHLVEHLLGRFRMLTDQSDHLFLNEKNSIRHELSQIQIRIGHYSSPDRYSLSSAFSSYLEYVQYLSSIPSDESERSYYNEPIYYPSNHTLFLPFGFLSRSNISIEYHLTQLLLKILRTRIQTNPYHIECSLKSFDDEQELVSPKKLLVNNEPTVYLILRSNFLSEQRIVLDEYLWPFMSANTLMKRFLIDYTAANYCRESNGYDLMTNNTYLVDDIHLIFRCQQANAIKQSKCIVS